MKYDVFISYRRADAQKSAIILQKCLVDDNVTAFLDKEGIDPGENWSDKLESVIKESLIVLMVIGKEWSLDRKFDENDWVFKEFKMAKEEKKHIIPILVDKAEVPPDGSLPESISELFRHQGLNVNTTNSAEINGLIKKIKIIIFENDYGKEAADFFKQPHYENRYTPKQILSNKKDVMICKARDTRLERDVVIRFYKDPNDPELLKKTLLKAVNFANVIPHSVQIFDADYDQHPHIVLDFMEGGTLRSNIDADLGSPSETVATQIKQVGRALRDVGTFHCNIKPSNVLLGENKCNLYLNPLNRLTVISKEKFKTDLLEIEKSGGIKKLKYKENLAYTPPEIINPKLGNKEEKNREGKIDQYQLGLLGIELLTGKMPCTFEKIEELDAPPSEDQLRERTKRSIFPPTTRLQSILLKMTEPRPGKRYKSLTVALEEISESTIKLRDTALVKKSYLRCLSTKIEEKSFMQSFYDEFMTDKIVREKFEKFSHNYKDTDSMQSQYNHLQGALFGLIEFAALVAEGENTKAIQLMEHIAKKHGTGKGEKLAPNYYIDISISLLSWFKKVLIECICGNDYMEISAFDPVCNKSETDRNLIKAAWEKVLNPGLEYMEKVIRKSNR